MHWTMSLYSLFAVTVTDKGVSLSGGDGDEVPKHLPFFMPTLLVVRTLSFLQAIRRPH